MRISSGVGGLGVGMKVSPFSSISISALFREKDWLKLTIFDEEGSALAAFSPLTCLT